MPEESQNIDNAPLILASGHVVKNVGRIEQIRARLEARVEVPFTSWECSRIIRRDFNKVSEHLYRSCAPRANAEKRREIGNLIMEFVLQGEMFDGESQAYEMTRAVEEVNRVPLRVVCHEARQVLFTFVTADKAMARLKCAVSDGLINNETRSRMFQSFLGPYMDLKHFVMGRQKSEKTADELGEELGVV